MNTSGFGESFRAYQDRKIALYGISTYTEDIIRKFDHQFQIVGILDGYKETGNMYGKPILSFPEIIQVGVTVIVLVARLSSQRIIFNRIHRQCEEHNIRIFDVQGNELKIGEASGMIHFTPIPCCKKELMDKTEDYDVISFDLFDTLVMRRTLYSSDVFELMDMRMREMGMQIPDFPKLRQSIERNLSQNHTPTLEVIYQELVKQEGLPNETVSFLVNLEFVVEQNILIKREDICEIFQYLVARNKEVWIVSDMYLNSSKLKILLSNLGLTCYRDVLVSCDYGTTKERQLFQVLLEKAKSKHILHIGDNHESDIVAAERFGIDSYEISSGYEMLEKTDLRSMSVHCDTLNERVKLGMLISRLFSNPFAFKKYGETVTIQNPYDLGYTLIAPILTDFVVWLDQVLLRDEVDCILFGARDGYLIHQLFDILQESKKGRGRTVRSEYFLTSRIASMIASIDKEEDISYMVDSSYNGSIKEMLQNRFFLHSDEVEMVDDTCTDWKKETLKCFPYISERAYDHRNDYRRYIESFHFGSKTKFAFFDFVSSGSCQLAIEKIMNQTIYGYYFMKTESNQIVKKRLNIQSFCKEKIQPTSGGIEQSYFILENFLTSFQPSLLSFDHEGNPVFRKESRSKTELYFIHKVHEGVKQYFREYIDLYPIGMVQQTKDFSELILGLVHRIKVENQIFSQMKLEDEFFHRIIRIESLI